MKPAGLSTFAREQTKPDRFGVIADRVDVMGGAVTIILAELGPSHSIAEMAANSNQIKRLPVDKPRDCDALHAVGSNIRRVDKTILQSTALRVSCTSIPYTAD
jgi:hypothetical protein